jgi:hypothetical protein
MDHLKGISDYHVCRNTRLERRINFYKSHHITHLLEQKMFGEIPIVFPMPTCKILDYGKNESEKNRISKIKNDFTKLKFFIENNQEKAFFYVKEFFAKNGIFEEKFYSDERINNFINFLFNQDNITIDPSQSIQQILKDGTKNLQPIDFKIIRNNIKNVKSSDKNIEDSILKQYQVNNIQTKINNKLDKKFKAELNNPKIFIGNLESELQIIYRDSSYDKNKHAKKKYNYELDIGINYQSKKENIEIAKKKQKLLEYTLLQRSKNIFN